MPRYFLPADQWATCALHGDEAHHCANVMRQSAGAEISLLDGAGRTGRAKLTSVTKREVQFTLLEEHRAPAPACEITLVQALIKGDNMEWVIEKAAELGATRIVPFIAQRSVVRLSTEDRLKKQQKWQRLALEACKQCGQPWLPAIAAPCSFAEALALISDTDLRLVASLENAAPTRLRTELPHSAAVLLGPEGDFTAEEYAALRSAGCQPWSLGPLVLRSETAAICALSILGYHWRSPS
jgi:16S rRNA (uracil1498-N3)-methyltransferase